MFFAVLIGRDDALERGRRAAEFHARALHDTGWFGRMTVREIRGGLVLWDGDSGHAQLTEDPGDGSLVLRGGYSGSDETGPAGHVVPRAGDEPGEFATVALAPGSSEVQVFADDAGSWPIYHGHRPDLVAASNDAHFVALALGITRLSVQAAYELLTYHHALGVDSTVQGVQRLLPGDVLRLTRAAGTASHRIESRPRYRYTRASLPPAELERSAFDALTRSTAMIGPLRSGLRHATLQISGGLDSRLTLAAIARVFDERPAAVTLDLSDPTEMEIARTVATRLGFAHRTATLAATGSDALRAGWLLTAGQVSPFAAAGNLLSYETAQRAPDGSVLLVGAWPGDCLIGSYVPLVPGMTSSVGSRVLARDWATKRAKDWAGSGVEVTGPEASRVARVARSKLFAALEGRGARSAAQRISYWAMFHRQPTFSYISPAVLTSDVLAITPVLAPAYLDHLLQLDGRQILGKNFYRSMIVHGIPELADVPYAATGVPISDEAVTVRRIPRSIEEAYERAPSWMRRAAGAIRRRRLRAGAPARSESTESRHWGSIFDGLSIEAIVELPGFRLDATRTNDVHVRSIALALQWTKEYLEEGFSVLGE